MNSPVGGAVAIVGHCVHVPGADAWQIGFPAGEIAPMVQADEAYRILGRKGLLGKEPATRLALCAVHRALGLPPGPLEKPLPQASRTGVVVSSNLGNLSTVCEIAAATRVEGYRAVSPMQTPNVSSNVIASTIAIRYGFTGPNVMLCNGATSGLDAVRIGARLIRAGRADRVVVVGAEPDDEIAQALVKNREPGRAALRAAAACVILSAPSGRENEVLLGDGGTFGPEEPREAAEPAGFGGLMFVPEDSPRGGGADDDRVIDLTQRLGTTYGALGVLQAAAATAQLTRPGAPNLAHLCCGDSVEGFAWQRIHAAGSIR